MESGGMNALVSSIQPIESLYEQRCLKRALPDVSYDFKRPKFDFISEELDKTYNVSEDSCPSSPTIENNDEEDEDSDVLPSSPIRPSTPPMGHLLNAPRKPAMKRLYFGRLERLPIRHFGDISDVTVFNLL
ncbi:unnamed protein product [Auanema sp. JU1783]|nr:unnamed protein product [Auanema sp. JU1783]